MNLDLSTFDSEGAQKLLPTVTGHKHKHKKKPSDHQKHRMEYLANQRQTQFVARISKKGVELGERIIQENIWFQKLFNSWRYLDIMMAIFSILSLVVSLIGYYGFSAIMLEFKKVNDNQNDKMLLEYVAVTPMRLGFIEVSMQSIRITSMVLTVIAILLLIAKRVVMLRWTFHFLARKDDDDLLKGYDHKIRADNFMTADLKPRLNNKMRISYYFDLGFLMEIIILCIFPWPFWDKVIQVKYLLGGEVIHSYTLISDYFQAIMLFRVFFAIRSFTNNSLFTDAFS